MKKKQTKKNMLIDYPAADLLDGMSPSVFRCTYTSLVTGPTGTCLSSERSLVVKTLFTTKDLSDDKPYSSYSSYTILNYFMPDVTNSYYSRNYVSTNL